MGNTMIQDSTTGNIMGLRDGFVPVGMKEYGGILYIASFNPQTQEGQLGTIPSPVINYTYKKTPYINSLDVSISDINVNSNTLLDPELSKYRLEPFKVSEERFQVGDQFIISLNLGVLKSIERFCYQLEKVAVNPFNPRQTGIKQPNTVAQPFIKAWTTKKRKYPLISGFYNYRNNYGLFKFILEAKVEKSSDTLALSNITSRPQKYYLETKQDIQQSDYWFINQQDITGTLDIERCQAADCYNTYPNILPGYLYIRTQVELPDNFKFFTNKSTGIESPNIFLITNQD